MKLIEWQEEFSLGIASVDHEHRELIELINSLHDTMRESSSTAAVLETLGEIYAQIASHFALEEKHMREHRYPAFNEHKQDHEALLDDLRDIMDEIEADGWFDEARLSQDMRRWFNEHFSTHDARLHSMLPHPTAEES